MNNSNNNIAANLRHLRTRLRLSQDEVAGQIGVTRQAVAKWENGDSLPDILNCEALADLFDVSLNDLVRHDPEQEGVPIGPKNKYYGFGLMIYVIFNVILLTQFFKTAYKVDMAFLLAIIPAAIAVVIMEVLVHFPGFEWLDSIVPNIMFRQLPILAVGVIVYIIGMLIAYRVSAKRFEQVDL